MKNTNHGRSDEATTKGTVSPVRIGKRYDSTTKKVRQAPQVPCERGINTRSRRARRDASENVNFLWRAGEKEKMPQLSAMLSVIIPW